MSGPIKERVIMWLAAIQPPCEVISRSISDSLDRRLSLRERLLIRLHLPICRWCTHYKSHLTTIRHALRESADPELDPETELRGLSPEARDRIRRRLRHSGERNEGR
ncbi:MAG TPA: zf-HC2 domain-containing protein [candidate division Zixibacteria bacterium]|jgi:predicted anti-sigma-YlaC factor YlaD